MSDNFVFIDNIYRSRHTLLDILEARGYEVAKYRKFSPIEATAAVTAPTESSNISLSGLNFTVTKKDDDTKKCMIQYEKTITTKKLESQIEEKITEDQCENIEIIVMMASSISAAHHKLALQQYIQPKESGDRGRRKLRVSFFSIYMMVINPLKHVLVPKHEIVPEDQHRQLMDSMYITSKSKFPEIKFHIDPIARCIGAVPGDIVKITRASASSGEAIIYRVCVP